METNNSVAGRRYEESRIVVMEVEPNRNGPQKALRQKKSQDRKPLDAVSLTALILSKNDYSDNR
jgi:hypothetical protein